MSRRRETARRVLIIVQDLPVPYDRRTWLVATTLRDAGYAVSVVSPKGTGAAESYVRLDGVDVYRYRLPLEARGALGYAVEFAWCFLAASLLSLRVELRGRGFDVIHACNPPETYWLLGRLWRPFGKRFLFDHHDLSPEMYEAKYRQEGGLLHRMLLWLERMTFATAHTAIATNDSYKRIACTRGGMPSDRVFVVRSGPDETRFRIVPAEPALKEGRPYLCAYVGKMCEQDGVDHLLRAARILVRERRRDDILFVLIGEGPVQPRLEEYARELGIAEHCRFPGYLPDSEICRYLSTADLAVDPDPKTAWADLSTMNKVLDYMFFGCPTVAFDLAENRYSAQESALWVTPNSETGLADAVEQLLADEERRRRMGELGKRRVREKLLWRYSAPQLIAAYDRLFRDP